MKELTLEHTLDAWTPDQFYAYLKANAAGFEGVNTMQERDPGTGALRGEIRVFFSDDTPILLTEQDLLDILASDPPPLPPAPETPEQTLATLKARLDAVELDVDDLKKRVILSGLAR